MFYPPYGTSAPSLQLESLSRCLFHLDMANLEIGGPTGLYSAGSFVADCGHTGLLTRGATASPKDQNNVAYTAQYVQPALERRDWNGSSSLDTFGLLMGTSDRLPFGINFRPMAMTGYAEFIQVAGGGAAFTISNAAASGAQLSVYQSASMYYVTHDNGSSSVNTHHTSVVALGDRIRLRWWLYATGAVQIFMSLNGGTETASTASGVPASGVLASSWPSSSSIYVNSIGSGSGGAMWLRRLKYMVNNVSASTIQTFR